MAKFRPFLLILISLALTGALLRPAITAQAGGTITITASGGTSGSIGNNAGASYDEAQSWFSFWTGTLTSFTFRLAANTGSPTGTITWKITEDSGSDSPGTVLGTGSLTPTASATNTVSSLAINVIAGGNYWLWLHSTTTQTSGNYFNWQASTAAYTHGLNRLSTNGGSTWSPANVAFGSAYQSSFTITDATATPTYTPPVPTATILPSSTPPDTPVPTATEKPNPTVVPDIDEPTATEKPNPTGQPTSTPYIFVPVPTATEKPNPTGIPTSTPANTPVDTPTAINTPVDTPTEINTPVETATEINTPVDTPTAINTPVDTPTEINTPVDTPTPFTCSCTGIDTATPSPTLTPTDTLTPSITPTPSDTPTPTPNLYGITTLEPSGQAGGILYLVSAGEAAIFAVLAFIIVILSILLFIDLRRKS